MESDLMSLEQTHTLAPIFHALMDSLSDIVMIYRVDGGALQPVAMNDTANKVRGISPDIDAIAQPIVHTDATHWLECACSSSVTSHEAYYCRRAFHHNTDATVVDVSVTPVLKHDICTHVVVIIKDFTTLKQNERKLMSLAFHDPLTHVYNRAFFEEQLTHAVTLYRRNQTPFSLALLDCDEFKTINDTLGHLVGDSVLIQLSERIQAITRSNDILARIGGDEFALLFDSTTVDQCVPVLERLKSVLSKPWVVEGRTLQLSCSIGLTDCTSGHSTTTLMQRADAALYRAKHLGKGKYFIDSDTVHRHSPPPKTGRMH